MKTIILALALLLAASSTHAIFASKTAEWIEGQWKYCKYSDGRVITIKTYELCPISLN